MTNYLRFFSGAVISFLLTPLMVHMLGDAGYGLWITVFSLTGYFGLVDQGIRPSLVRYVSRDRAAGDMDGLSRTLSSALALYTVAGVVTLAVCGVIAWRFGISFHIDPAMLPAARTTILVAGLSLALGFPFGVFGATLSGLQRYDLANGIGIVISILRAVAFVVVLRSGGGIVELAWASLACNLLGHVWTLIVMRRLLPEARFSPSLVSREHMARVGSYGSIAFIGALASTIAFQTDSLVITAFLGAAAVTPFALAAGLVDNVRSLVHSATWVLSPTASEMETLGETAPLQGMLIAGARYSVLLSWPILFALIVFGENLFVTWIGDHARIAARLLIILSVPTLLSLPQSAASSMLYGISRHKGVVVLSIANAVLNLALSLLWVRPYGLEGVALGTAVPLGLIAGFVTAWYAARVMKLPLSRYLGEGVLRPGLCALSFLVPALLIQWRWHPIGWIPLALAVAGSWLAFAAVTWRFGIDTADRARWARMLSGAMGRPPSGPPVVQGEAP
ncbi:MAG: oligosaccharide flippase family protein [Candidatus Eisenbacteria bacterium]|uniref:Oligosaccharide flippase family protein n=1 Tax=Eiseniibacteriota bacterium TaxID=2212470 RepID=A0A849SGT8_UNCEI|nr:oligosaccharide flippase family protein [Candidatus Eisenbacteria bacterium]